jgi:hypothetical protein
MHGKSMIRPEDKLEEQIRSLVINKSKEYTRKARGTWKLSCSLYGLSQTAKVLKALMRAVGITQS